MNKGKFRWKPLIIALALPLGAGTLSSVIVGDRVLVYASMNKPPLSPPGWVFPAVWTVLYALMGLASWLVYCSGASEPRKRRALRLYLWQLGLNFLWPIVFFGAGMYLAAFFLLLLLLLLVAVCTLRFYCIDERAGRLMFPYSVWLVFAAYLNLGVYLLN